MSVVGIKTAIVAKFNAMQTLKGVFSYEASNPDGKYPMATVTLAGGDGEFASTAHNLRRRQFTVNIYQEQTEAGQGSSTAEAIVVSVIDELEAAFDMDTTLSGSCKFVQPTGFDAGYVDREHDSRILTITIEATDIVSAN